ncbi:NADP-dependent oxidoreductase [Lentzea sp. BCCO 10_0061]|uniref:NADP-dependent oxidoreductase n=1 Tax=Lentzea sokolovensis TaxID=3095429 RepID=A0ABU4UVZ5_9PSEU|nr:NADP-dependent oxidoreductase [Lentzea sp. BCCO 10_0061]MDX8143631.1 NADP-dependent oxidoreductase [Lentzea sp. BCCO 10_0061]
MRALQFTQYGPADLLHVAEVSEPHAGPGQIRIAVRASGVTPGDTYLRSGMFGERLPLPHVPGVDAAGVVDEVGEGVTGVEQGDEVFGLVDLALLGGANAEFAVLAAWAPKPAALSWEQAGGAAANVETATRALDLLGVRDGTTLLIAGAAGGVGTVAIQLAVARGVKVVGTAGPATQDFVASLGATPVVYGDGLADRVGAVDAVLHCAGTVPDLISIAGSPDRVVTIADLSGDHGIRLTHTAGGPDADPQALHGLAIAAALAEQGAFTVPLAEVFPLDRGADAHRLSETGHAHGKIVLV